MEFLSIFYSLLLSVGFMIICLVLLLFIFVFLTTNTYEVVKRHKEEETFFDPKTASRLHFPSISDPQSLNLSIIVPAYNEEERLPPMLNETFEFMEKRIKEFPAYKYEVIVVSDGSKDNTVNVAEDFTKKYGSDKIRCLELIENRGKGGAVQLGVQSSRGATILFADADGASKFEDLVKLERALKDIISCDPVTEPELVSQKVALSIGSRAHLERESLATRSLFRAFDVELLYIAQKLNIPIAEVSVRWTEIEGSKVTPVLSWIQMGCDLGLIWLKYRIGVWKVKCNKIN